MTVAELEIAITYLAQVERLASTRAHHDQTLHQEVRADFGYIAKYAVAVKEKLQADLAARVG